MSAGILKLAISNNVPEENLSIFISTNRGDAAPSVDQIRCLKD
jgi:hypothetical protein